MAQLWTEQGGGPPAEWSADDVHRVLGKFAQVGLHRHPERLDRNRLKVRSTISRQWRGRLGIGDGVERGVVMAEVEAKTVIMWVAFQWFQPGIVFVMVCSMTGTPWPKLTIACWSRMSCTIRACTSSSVVTCAAW